MELVARLRLKDEMSSKLTRVMTSVSRTNGMMRKVTGSTGAYEQMTRKASQSVNNLANSNKMMSSSTGILGMSLTKLTGILGGLAIGAKAVGVAMDAFKTAADFESSMSRVGALSGATRSEMALLTQEAKDLGATTVFSASQAAEGMSFLAMAGYKTNDIIAAMPGLLDAAAAGQTELGETADIVSNILSGFGIAASETGRVADVLTKTFTSSNTDLRMLGYTMKYVAPVAKSLGFSLEEVSAAAGTLGNAGIQADMAGTSLRMGLLRLANPPKEAAKALRKLNVEVAKNGKMKDLATIIEDMSAGMAKLSETDRAAFVAEIVGTEAASSFLTLIDAGPEKLRAFTRELERSNGAAKTIATRQLDNFNGSVKLLESALESLKINAVGPLLPTFQKITTMLARMAEQYGPKIAETFEGVGRSISEFLDPYINDPKSWTVEGQAEFKFKQLEMMDRQINQPTAFWKKLTGNFEEWYDTSGRKMLEDGASKIASDFAGFLESNGPAITKAAASIGGKIAYSLIDGYFAGMRGNLVGQGILQLTPGIGNAANAKGLYDYFFPETEEDPDAKAYHGIDYVRRDGLVTELHRGERVLTAKENREYSSGGGGGGVTITGNTFVVNAAGGDVSDPKVVEKIAHTLARQLHSWN